MARNPFAEISATEAIEAYSRALEIDPWYQQPAAAIRRLEDQVH